MTVFRSDPGELFTAACFLLAIFLSSSSDASSSVHSHDGASALNATVSAASRVETVTDTAPAPGK